MRQCILNKVYSDAVPPYSKLIPNAGSFFDVLLINVDNYSEFEIKTNVSTAELQQLPDVTPTNFTLSKDYVLLKTAVVILQLSQMEASLSEVIHCEKSIWSLLRSLILMNAELKVNNEYLDLISLAASRSSDNLIIRYKSDKGFKTHVVFNLFASAASNAVLEFRLGLSDCEEIQREYPLCTSCADGLLRVELQKAVFCSLPRNSFKRIVTADLILQQQRQIEIYKTCKLASSFSSEVMKALFSVVNTRDIDKQRKHEMARTPARLSYDVRCSRPTRAELTGLLYGCSAAFFLDIVKKSLQGKADLTTYLAEIIPQNDYLYLLFKQEFAALTVGSETGYDSTKYVDYTEECDLELALLYTSMCEFKCMLVEYDYYPPQLMDGISIDGILLKLKKENIYE